MTRRIQEMLDQEALQRYEELNAKAVLSQAEALELQEILKMGGRKTPWYYYLISIVIHTLVVNVLRFGFNIVLGAIPTMVLAGISLAIPHVIAKKHA